MHWVALQWQPESAADLPAPESLAWWALRFTPRVVWVDEALLLEISTCERLWRGRAALLRRLAAGNPAAAPMRLAQGATSLQALAYLRLQVEGVDWSSVEVPDLPLRTLGAARPHWPVLLRLGCRTWGQADALPRAGLARRFGPALGQALDVALGRVPETPVWVTLPERFSQSLELPAHTDNAPALLWSASRLLTSLQLWLRARQLGVLAFELMWKLDRRASSRTLPPSQSLVVRTARPAQAIEHLRRLLTERLARIVLPAPAVALKIRALQTVAWRAESKSLLLDDVHQGEPLHVFMERAGARLGPGHLLRPVLRADHRPELRQCWQEAEAGWPAASIAPGQRPVKRSARKARGLAPDRPQASGRDPDPEMPRAHLPMDVLAPTSLLHPPQPLTAPDGRPRYRGQTLRLLLGPQRIEAGWWPEYGAEHAPAVQSVARDYFIAQGPALELLWIYRERPVSRQQVDTSPCWYLHGIYV